MKTLLPTIKTHGPYRGVRATLGSYTANAFRCTREGEASIYNETGMQAVKGSRGAWHAYCMEARTQVWARSAKDALMFALMLARVVHLRRLAEKGEIVFHTID